VRLLAITIGLFLTLSAAPVARSVTDRQTRTVDLSSGRRVSVNITIGELRILGEPRQDALLEIVRTAPTLAGLNRILLASEESATEVRFTAVQANDDKDPAYRTDLTMRVPRAANLSAIRIAEGRLTLQSFAGNIDATVRRGSIDATDVQGTVRLETEIGDITVNRARLLADGLLRLRTFNGDVRLSLAERPSDARILALALNGTIASDIPLQKKESWGPRFGEATLGKGEPVMSIDVVTGRIVIASP
jgi:hypothetical protein